MSSFYLCLSVCLSLSPSLSYLFIYFFIFGAPNHWTGTQWWGCKLARQIFVFLAFNIYDIYASEVQPSRQRVYLLSCQLWPLYSNPIFTTPSVPGTIHLQPEGLLYYHIHQFVLCAHTRSDLERQNCYLSNWIWKSY